MEKVSWLEQINKIDCDTAISDHSILLLFISYAKTVPTGWARGGEKVNKQEKKRTNTRQSLQ